MCSRITNVRETRKLRHHCDGGPFTYIHVYDFNRTSTGTTEFDLEKDRYDIRIPSDVYESMKDTSQQPDNVTSYIPESFYSLRVRSHNVHVFKQFLNDCIKPIRHTFFNALSTHHKFYNVTLTAVQLLTLTTFAHSQIVYFVSSICSFKSF